ncbi:MAG: hypothetical protein HFACDABA_01163 [Anaerolineales bacterium]|nr:hypothetical protein [Anaerolineales bacterium]
MNGSFFSHLNPKLISGPFHLKGGCGIIARQPISKHEVLAFWGGRIITRDELDPTMPDFSQRVLQVEEELFLFNPLSGDPADCFNHSCDPNAGLSGATALIAMRDIAAGEEITFDYAMCDDTDYDEFDCNCGQPHCRGRVTGADWRHADLQERYAGYFSPFIQRKIEAEKVAA